jgi:uncharacterized protein HemX
MPGDPTTAILVAVIGGMALILAALIGVGIPALVSIRKHTVSTNNQVVNDHDTNMRVENDARHAAEMQLLRSQGRRLGRIERRLSIVETTQQKQNRESK